MADDRDKPEFVTGDDRFAHVGVKKVSSEEAERCDVVLAPRVGSIPDPDPDLSWQADCSYGCGHKVWAHALDPVTPPRVCTECYVASARPQ